MCLRWDAKTRTLKYNEYIPYVNIKVICESIMSRQTRVLTDELYEYLHAISPSEPEIMTQLRERTATMPMAVMQISLEQAQFMQLLIQLIGAKKVLEIGTFTGYSALAMALALPVGGKLVTCDISDEWTSIAQEYWHRAEIAEKIDLRLAPALETLDLLLADSTTAGFDFIFIDADKANYPHYYERSLQLLRSGGLIAIDNVFMQGKVVDPMVTSKGVVAIRQLNQAISCDKRVTFSVVPIGDGLTLVRKM